MKTQGSTPTKPVAIVGMSALFPEAEDLHTFWDNIVAGRDCSSDVPPSRWKIDDHYDPDPTVPDRTYSRRGGFIPDIDFDPLEWGLPPNSLEVTDVAQLLSLVLAKRAFADAGYGDGARAFDRERTGVVLGVGGGQKLISPLTSRLQEPVWRRALETSGVTGEAADLVVEKIAAAYIGWEEDSFPGMLGNVIAGRIANRFDLGGINCVVDAACAASLAALRMALDELAAGRADMMLTGGVDADNSPFMYLCFSKTPAFSRSNRIRPFDADSDGMLVGEGLGMLVLKRLADAERDGDRIYAVIRGLGASSDGRFKSIYAPRSEGQERALRRAYEAAGVAPASLGLVEAHGTGTIAGDLCEVETLRRVLDEGAGVIAQPHIALGSVKSQIGHTKAAAGAAGLIKTALALHHKVLPPTINVERPNPALRLDGSSLYLNGTGRPWMRRSDDEPRRAAVSAFGFGGTNFHVVLEEHEREHASSYRLHGLARELVVGAAGPSELVARCTGLAAAVVDHAAFAELADQLAAEEISDDAARIGFVATAALECAGILRQAAERLASEPDAESWSLPDGVHYRRRAFATGGDIAALFPGQGSQYVGMGRSLALSFPPIRAWLARADGLFREDGEELLSDAVHPPTSFDEPGRVAQEERLRATELAQPAIGALSAGLFDILRSAGFAPDFVGGHSFGELTALWAADSLDDDAFLRLARDRGRAMTVAPETDAGAMLAVRGDRHAVGEAIAGFDDVLIANVNAPDQVVLAGPSARITDLRGVLADRGFSTVPLPVAAAFHTPLVAHARHPFAKAIEASGIRAPSIPVFANSTGAAYPDHSDGVAAVLGAQLVQPVQWVSEIEALYDAGARVFVEIGPRSVLTGLVRRILGAQPHVAIALDGGPERSSDRQLRDAVVQLRVLGLKLGPIDPYARKVPSPEPTDGRRLTVRLNGASYVSDTTRAAYEATLARTTTTTTDKEPTDVRTNGSLRLSEPIDGNASVVTAAPPTEDARSRLLAVVENGMAELHAHQREILQLQQQVLTGQFELTRALLERGSSPAAPGQNDAVLDVVQRQQAAMLLQHDGFVAQQTQFAETLLGTLARQATALVGESVTVVGPEEPVAKAPVGAAVAPVESELFEPATPTPSANGSAPAAIAPPVAPAPAAPPPDIAAPVEAPAAGSPVAHPALTTAPSSAPSGGIDLAELENVMLEVVSEKTGYPVASLELEMDMEADLGIDSIKRVEILGAMQARYPQLPPLRPDDLAVLRTLAQVVGYVHQQVSLTSPADERDAPTPSGSGAIVSEPRLQALPAPDALELALPAGYCAVVTDDGTALTGSVAAGLLERGWPTVVLRFPSSVSPVPSLVPAGVHEESLGALDEESIRVKLEQIVVGHGPIGTFVHLHPQASGSGLAGPAQEALVRAVFLASTQLRSSLEQSARIGRGSFVVVTRLDGALGTDGGSADFDPAGGGLYGLAKTIRLEWPTVFSRAVDLAPSLADETAALAVLAELTDPDERLVEVAYGPNGRVTLVTSMVGSPTG